MWTSTQLEEIKQQILPQFREEILEFNDFLANNPELGNEEFLAIAGYEKILAKHSITMESNFCNLPTAFRATINSGKEKKFALLCEYDALPEIGHACGHCASGSASLWTFLALAKIANQIDAQVDLIGTPNEENEGLKCVMANKGVFESYDFAAMCHLGPTNTLDVNFIALDGITIEFHGKAAHAAQAPHLGANALNSARLFFDAIDMMRQHVIPEVRLHGFIEHGGVASNIVPDYTKIKFLMRAPKKDQLEDLTNWVRDCATAAALATRTQVSFSKYGEVYYDLQFTPEKRKICERIYETLNLSLNPCATPFSGSSDIGNVDYSCPAFHPIVGIGRDDLNIHTAEFAAQMTETCTHTAIEKSAQILLEIPFEIYGKNGQLNSLKNEFSQVRHS